MIKVIQYAISTIVFIAIIAAIALVPYAIGSYGTRNEEHNYSAGFLWVVGIIILCALAIVVIAVYLVFTFIEDIRYELFDIRTHYDDQ